MAIRAHHLAFAQRHVRRAHHLHLPVLVTLEAGIRLGRGLQLALDRHRFHDRVAVRAHQTTRLVRAAAPIGSVALLVAGEAHAVVFFRRARLIFRPERDDPAHAASAAGLCVRRARTVAVFAIELAFLCLADAAHQRLFKRRGLAGMAGQANLRADKLGFDRSG